MVDNESVEDSITVEVVENETKHKKIVISPANITELYEGDNISFLCEVYLDGVKQLENVNCVATNADEESYKLTKIETGYELEVVSQSEKELVLTFSASDCDDIVMTIELIGLL